MPREALVRAHHMIHVPCALHNRSWPAPLVDCAPLQVSHFLDREELGLGLCCAHRCHAMNSHMTGRVHKPLGLAE